MKCDNFYPVRMSAVWNDATKAWNKYISKRMAVYRFLYPNPETYTFVSYATSTLLSF